MSNSRDFMHPAARAAFDAACKAADIRPVIVQTEGSAAASAGTHASDGKYPRPDGTWHSYSAALDLSVKQNAKRVSTGEPLALNEERIKWLLYNLALHGFAGWYRRPSQGFDAVHLHVIFCGVKMKPALQRQVRDFLADRTGLASHGVETFWTAPPEVDAKLRAIFEEAN